MTRKKERMNESTYEWMTGWNDERMNEGTNELNEACRQSYGYELSTNLWTGFLLHLVIGLAAFSGSVIAFRLGGQNRSSADGVS